MPRRNIPFDAASTGHDVLLDHLAHRPTKWIVHRLPKRLGVVLQVGERSHHHAFDRVEHAALCASHEHAIEVVQVFVEVF